MKAKKRTAAAPMSEEEFRESWDALLRIFLLIADDGEWFDSQTHLAAPFPLLQEDWRVSANSNRGYR